MFRYFNKCPAENIYQYCYILDPMLATGGTAIAAAAMLKVADRPIDKY